MKFYALNSVAALLHVIEPISATLIYRQLIALVLDETKFKYYDYTAQDLVTGRILDSKISNWRVSKSHEEYLEMIEKKHKIKIKFWSEYKSTLQNQVAKAAKIARSGL